MKVGGTARGETAPAGDPARGDGAPTGVGRGGGMFRKSDARAPAPDRRRVSSCRLCGAADAAIGRRAFLKGVAAASATAPLAGCGEADIGWLAHRLVSPEAEAELGRHAFQQISAKMPLARDPRQHALVGRIGARIVEASGSPVREWVFAVFESEQVNAFALPGGRVGVFTGMLKAAANEDQLAAVIGHEVGHVNARHGAERIVAEQGIVLALRLGAMLLALGDVPIPPDLVVALGASAAEFGIVRPFSRAQELEADVLGLEYMAAAGYRPREAVAFWRRMQQLSGNDGVPQFLATHPSSARRIEELLRRLPELENAAGRPISPAVLALLASPPL
jgi:predicted Zn-dependent protease